MYKLELAVIIPFAWRKIVVWREGHFVTWKKDRFSTLLFHLFYTGYFSSFLSFTALLSLKQVSLLLGSPKALCKWTDQKALFGKEVRS